MQKLKAGLTSQYLSSRRVEMHAAGEEVNLTEQVPIGTVVNFWTPPKTPGGHVEEKYVGWHS